MTDLHQRLDGPAARTHLTGITGLRGVSVAAVVAYHLGYLPGGFVGVDVFFVLSGFLITTLLLGSPPEGFAGLRRWWGRRVTRLTPAVVVVVVAVLVVFATQAGIVRDSIATLTWWQNWNLIAEGQPYWAAEPSPLRHAWSLSIEEQFYVAWPLILLTTLAVARRRRRTNPARLVGRVALTLALSSFGWAAWLAMRSGEELSRVYFGTDTRAGALLIGCAAAAMLHGRPAPAANPVRDLTALGGLAVLCTLSWIATPEDRWIYTGGLGLAALGALALVNAVRGDGAMTTALSLRPLQWLGARSYAIYLWSWPLQIALEVRWPGLSRDVVAAITVVGSLLLSSISLRVVEEPLRRGTAWARRPTPRRTAWVGGTVVVVLALAFGSASAQPSVAEQVAPEFERLPDPTTTLPPSTTTTVCVPPPPDEPAPAWTGDTSQFEYATVEEVADPTTPPVCEDQVTTVLIVGDSTGRGAANGLRRLAAPDLEIWDRTVLACGLVPPSEKCPDWRVAWPQAIAEIDPELVVVYVRTWDDLIAGPEPGFLTAEGAELRRREFADAMRMLSAGGARVAWVLPAAPLEIGQFYCDMRRQNSPCDPDWVQLWRDDVATVAAELGVPTLDVAAWAFSRGDTMDADRPDGLHFSGGALDAHAAWLAEQLRAIRP